MNGIKVHAVLFYFDFCNKKYYEDLKRLVSQTPSFSQVSSQVLSPQDLRKNKEYFDLYYWDNDFHPVIFSTWIKDYGVETFFEMLSKPNPSNQLNTPNRPKSYCNEKPTISNHIYDSKILTKPAEHLNNDSDFITSTQIANQSTISNSKPATVVKRKKKLKYPTKFCNVDSPAVVTTQTDLSKAEKEFPTPGNSDICNIVSKVLHAQINDSKTNKSSEKSRCLKISFDGNMSQNAISEVKSQVSSSKDLHSENFILLTTQKKLPKKETKKANPKISIASADRMATPNEENQNLLLKQTGNVSTSQMKANVPKRKNKGKSRKKKIDPELIYRVKEEPRPFIFTKTIITNNGAEELKLIGKFARTEEEKQTNCKTVITKVASKKLSHTKKYKCMDYKRKSTGETSKRNKVTEQFVIMRLQIKPKYSKRKQMPNVETVDKTLQKSCSTNRQNMNDDKCPHLRTEECVSNYAEFLSETCYFKHFKKSKYFNDKCKDLPKNLILYKHKKRDTNNAELMPSYQVQNEQIKLLKYTKFYDD